MVSTKSTMTTVIAVCFVSEKVKKSYARYKIELKYIEKELTCILLTTRTVYRNFRGLADHSVSSGTRFRCPPSVIHLNDIAFLLFKNQADLCKFYLSSVCYRLTT